MVLSKKVWSVWPNGPDERYAPQGGPLRWTLLSWNQLLNDSKPVRLWFLTSLWFCARINWCDFCDLSFPYQGLTIFHKVSCFMFPHYLVCYTFSFVCRNVFNDFIVFIFTLHFTLHMILHNTLHTIHHITQHIILTWTPHWISPSTSTA